jgi:hypothetical protein
MLALPIPSDTSSREYLAVKFCNTFAKLMAMEPASDSLETTRKAIEEFRQLNIQTNPDLAHLPILDAMYANYRSAIGDPLSFRAPAEIATGAVGEVSLEDFVTGADNTYMILEVMGGPLRENPDIIREGRRTLEMQYSKSPVSVQAGLLIAYFNNTALKPLALEFLAKWFIDCDLKVDRIAFERYLEASKAKGCEHMIGCPNGFQQAFDRWKSSEVRTVGDLAEEERKQQGARLKAEVAGPLAGAAIAPIKPAEPGSASFSPSSSKESLYKRQCRLRDEMLALPIPVDTSSCEYRAAKACNTLTESMIIEPFPDHLNECLELIESIKDELSVSSHLQIMDAMLANYRSALGDPLSFRAPAEIATGVGLEESLESFISQVDCVCLSAVVMSRAIIEGKPWITQQSRIGLERQYSKWPVNVQAGLLIAFFYGDVSKPIALELLAKWFNDCDLRVDRIAFERYLEAIMAVGYPHWAITLNKFQQALDCWKSSEARTVGELAKEEQKKQEERRKAEAERIAEEARQQAERERKQTARAAAGVCVLCGKPLGWKLKLFKAKQHEECTDFID